MPLSGDTFAFAAGAKPVNGQQLDAGTQHTNPFTDLESAISTLAARVTTNKNDAEAVYYKKAKHSFYDVSQNHDLTGTPTQVTAAIQAAQAAAPAGATLVYPPGTYTINSTITMTRNHSHLFNGTVFSFNLANNNTDGIAINSAVVDGFDGMRTQDFEGLQFSFSGPGRYGINVQGTVANIQNNFKNILGFSNTANPMSFAVRSGGAGPHWNTWDSCFFGSRGILDESADGNWYHRCGFYGTLGIYFNKVVGAFKSKVSGSFFAMGGIAICIVQGEAIDIDDSNSFEHGDPFVAPVAPYDGTGASVINIPASIVFLPIYNQPIRFNRIVGNNFGGGNNITNSIYFNAANASNKIIHTLIDQNVFGKCTPGGGAQTADLVISNSFSEHTVWGVQNKPRGDRTAITGSNAPFLLTDSGTGTVGVWRFVAPSNGWTLGSGACYFRKTVDGKVEFRGRLTAGTKTAATTVFTLPSWFTPFEAHTIGIVGNVTGTMNSLTVQPGGNVNIGPVAFNTTDTELHMSGVSWPVVELPSTDPGV